MKISMHRRPTLPPKAMTFHSAQQAATVTAAMPVFEADAAGRIKINPLASWSDNDVADYFCAHDLLPPPLEVEGYLSIGCMPCSDRQNWNAVFTAL